MHAPLKRGFTLIELLVVIAIIAILAAILFPVFAQARSKARQTTDISNMKQSSLGILQYIQDYDETMPQAFSNDRDFGWLWGFGMDVPADWEKPGPIYLADVSTAWPNCTFPYTKNHDIVNSPGAQEYKDPGTTYVPGYKTVAQTYNGLLQSFPTAGIVSPATCPLIWEAYGNLALAGYALAEPQLECDDPTAPCVYQSPSGYLSNGNATSCANGNGSTSVSFGLSDTVKENHWVYSGGQNFSFDDGHAKWRRMGAVAYPPTKTDRSFDPYSRYDTNGNDLNFAWTDGCHHFLFRPDWNGP
jgi:prepilin-type N-terminal cleavage/methylation domain-containing protein